MTYPADFRYREVDVFWDESTNPYNEKAKLISDAFKNSNPTLISKGPNPFRVAPVLPLFKTDNLEDHQTGHRKTRTDFYRDIRKTPLSSSQEATLKKQDDETQKNCNYNLQLIVNIIDEMDTAHPDIGIWNTFANNFVRKPYGNLLTGTQFGAVYNIKAFETSAKLFNSEFKRSGNLENTTFFRNLRAVNDSMTIFNITAELLGYSDKTSDIYNNIGLITKTLDKQNFPLTEKQRIEFLTVAETLHEAKKNKNKIASDVLKNGEKEFLKLCKETIKIR